LEEIGIVAIDEDEEDTLTFAWDIGDILSENQRGTDYDFDPTTGDLWFYTTDGDIPEFETVVSVSDGNGGYDEVKVIYEIENVNDPPFINVPAEKSTIEGEYLYITPEYGDPDMDSGEIITFSYYMGALESVTPSSAIEFSQSTGRLVIKAVNEEMNGEWEINITVVDLDGAADWGICKVVINNVNDPPVTFPINVEQEDENLTVIFRTLEAEDEDEDDTLTYIWDFGDGSDPVTGVDQRNVLHTFPTAGAYTVTLTVSDGQLNSEVREIILTVSAPPPDPDLDGDTMLNEWETKYGLDPTDPSDADLDLDDDGLTNAEEFDYYDDKGIYLNPWNPDTDGDGFDDGDEVDNGYDPIDPGSHPEDPNKDISFLLWMGAVVLLVLFLLAIVVFIVLKVRNRPEPIASPTAAVPTYQELPPAGYYEQMPPDGTSYLPPVAGSYDDAYDQGQGQQWPAVPPQDQYSPQEGAYQYGNGSALDQQGEPLGSYPQGFGQMEMQPAPEVLEDQYQSIPLESTTGPFTEQSYETPASEGPPGQEPPQLDQMDGATAQDPEGAPSGMETENAAPETGDQPSDEGIESGHQEKVDQPKEEGSSIPPPPVLEDP
jgi:PKD repeat protein